MSDFVKTMRNWRRMCNAFVKQYNNDCCKYCPLDHLKSCGTIWEIENGTYGDLEEAVEAWAAEHPEPVYPTWAEWLEEMGLTRRSVIAARATNAFEPDPMPGIPGIPFITVLSLKASNPIPADIAEKLGLKPKGGNEND